MSKFSEKHPRSLVKVITWRVLISISHIVNGFIVSGSWVFGLQIAGVAAIVASIAFWSHERVWNHFDWLRQANESIRFSEKQGRTFSKIVSWRILITGVNFLIPYIMTGSWKTGIEFMGIATVVNMILYWSHERIWNSIAWGKTSNAK